MIAINFSTARGRLKDFCDRVIKYTDKIYVTTMYSETAEGNFESLNGNIIVS